MVRLLSALLLLLASPAFAERVNLEGACTFICPTGWEVDGFQPNAGTAMVTCKAKTPDEKGDVPTLFVGQSLKWGNPNYVPLERQIRLTGDRFLKQEEFLGRRATFMIRSNRAIVYIPIHGGYFQLGYRAAEKSFDRNSKTFLELMRSFRILGPCNGKTSCRLRRVAVPPKARGWSVSVRQSSSDMPLETSYRSFEHGASHASASAAVYRSGKRCRLVIAIYPEALERWKAHIEVHYLIDGNSLASAEAMLIEVEGERGFRHRMDSIALSDAAIPFSEIIPQQAEVLVQRLNPCASDFVNNSGTLKAAFGHPSVGRVVIDYDTIGVQAM
ncbi:MAG: hypothetical protein HY922_13380 [Elusimicrobia bacterium]|nr:hypothetical protein [Elusimicrobiota bacterium]